MVIAFHGFHFLQYFHSAGASFLPFRLQPGQLVLFFGLVPCLVELMDFGQRGTRLFQNANPGADDIPHILEAAFQGLQMLCFRPFGGLQHPMLAGFGTLGVAQVKIHFRGARPVKIGLQFLHQAVKGLADVFQPRRGLLPVFHE